MVVAAAEVRNGKFVFGRMNIIGKSSKRPMPDYVEKAAVAAAAAAESFPLIVLFIDQ